MPQWKTRFARVGESAARLERFLLPAVCIECGNRLEAEQVPLVCGLCRHRWPRLPSPLCERCGQPLGYGLPCRICEDWETLGRVRSAVWLESGARRIAHLFKYEGWSGAAHAMAAAMQRLEPLTDEVFLVPVPLSPRRERRRGYNQAALLADALGQRTGLTVDGLGLRRVRETQSQTALPPEARLANVAGAFAAEPALDRAVVLVDDVFTTGATLGAAADALVRAGARRVEAVTFARALPPVA